MTTEEAKSLCGGSVRNLANTLGITEQAVHQWGGKVPELREYQLRDLFIQHYQRDARRSGAPVVIKDMSEGKDA